MPYVCSPDSAYIMDSAYELLELTADVHPATFFAGFNLNSYFDSYDAHYMTEGACPAIKNLNSLMHNWTDKQDDKTRAIVLSHNIYNSDEQLRELMLGATNKLVKNYLKNNGFVNENDNLLFYFREEDDEVNIYSESDIVFPANIATAVLSNRRSYDFIIDFKDQLKKSFEINHSLSTLVNAHRELCTKQQTYTLFDGQLVSDHKIDVKRTYDAKKALKKGIKKFTNLFGNDKIQSFISGNGFTVEGAKYNWHFEQRKAISILSMTHSPLSGHIPYILTLMTKENLEIANCCVYVENNIPIIDQIITIMLYIQHDEKELLENCNLFNMKQALETVTDTYNNKRNEPLETYNDSILSSAYTDKFNELHNKLFPIIKQNFSKIIGIEDNFFNYLATKKENPIIANTNETFFLDKFGDSKKLIKI